MRLRPTTASSFASPLLSISLWWALAVATPLHATAQTAPEGAAAWPPELSQALRASGLPADAVSWLVLPVDGGPPRLAHAADTPRLAASVMKLFTTGVALRTLGPAHTWRTDIGLGGRLDADGTLHGALHIRGSGDPSLVIERLHQMLSRWRGAGLREIRDGIVIDRSLFQLPPHDPAAFDGQALKPYNAGPDAFLINHQAVTLRFAADASTPGRGRVSLEPALHGVTLHASLPAPTAAGGEPACGDWRSALKLSVQPMAGWPHDGRQRWRIDVQGAYPGACGEREWPLLWQGDDAHDHASRVLTQAWLDLGGRLGGHENGPVRSGPWPDGMPVWQSWASVPLANVVRDINKFSNNVMARQLFLTLATTPAASGAPRSTATLEGARSAVARQVQRDTDERAPAPPCEGEALVLDNGSGLSRTERSSAACLGAWLQAMWQSPVMPEFVASLPVNGLDGTTRRWQAAAGQAHIKTGSLDGVATVAGYVLGESGRRHIIVGLVNHPRADNARPLLQALIEWTRRDR